MKHTPGPWELGEHHVDRGNPQISSPQDFIGEVYLNCKEAEANARLIAQSPELKTRCRGAAIQLRHIAETIFKDLPGNPKWESIATDCQELAFACEQTLAKAETD